MMITTHTETPSRNGHANSGRASNPQPPVERSTISRARREPSPPSRLQPQPASRRRRVSPSAIAIVAAVAALIASSLLYAASRGGGSDGGVASETARALPVDVATVALVDSYAVSRSYSGEVVARRKSRVGFERAGKLARMQVDEGAAVALGEPLAVLDTEHLETKRRQLVAQAAQARAVLDELVAGPRRESVDAARATVKSLTAQVDLLRLQTARAARLLAKNAISRDEYDVTSHSYTARKAELENAHYRLKELLNGTRKEQIQAQRAVVEQTAASIADVEVDLRKSTLLAPYSGTIASRLVDEGTVVEAGMPIVELVEDTNLEAWIGVPPRLASSLAIGSRHEITVDEVTIDATVSGVVPAIDPATQTRTIIFTLAEAETGRLVDGQIARIELSNTVRQRGSWIPASAIQRDTRGLWIGFVLKPPKADDRRSLSTDDASTFRLARHYLEVLHMQGDRVFVRGTLSDGQRIVRDGVHRLVAGQIVQAVN